MRATPKRKPDERFSDRVENYIRFRPGYPREIIPLIEMEAALKPGARIADIGSGTGISSEMFLRAGYQVTCVEPNRAMREAAERLLADYPGFRSVDGSAQSTTLEDGCIDLIVAAQAFHWFDTPETRAEFSRILKPGGRIALIWNERKLDGTPFLRDYENLLLRFGMDYSDVRHENIGAESLGRFFIGDYSLHTFPNHQEFDFESLKGRMLSSSYVPSAGHPDHEPMIAELRGIHERHQVSGKVDFEYDTRVYLGR